MNIYAYDNIHVMQDGEDIIVYGKLINNNQILTSSGEVQF